MPNAFRSNWLPGTLAIVMSLSVISDSWGIIRRDDRDDSLYTSLADTSFRYGGMVETNNGSYVTIGSGTLISSSWIITAAHCVSGYESKTFVTAAGTYGIDQVIFQGSYDIALAHLSTPLTSIAPVKLYSTARYGLEDGRECIIMGAGDTGIGSVGDQGSPGTLRAAQSYVLTNAGNWGWSSADILTYFRSPNEGAAYLEGTGAPGDSGGGLLLNVNGEWTLAGVQSYSWYNDAIGVYGTGSGYIRTGPLLDWILSNVPDATEVPEPATLLLFAFGGPLLLCKRYSK